MESRASMDDQFLALIDRIIEENLTDENFSVEKLAEEAGLSRSMLHRKLVKLTGKSATDYIMDKRLNRAKELLENNVATVSEIAYKVGFNSTSYFHRAFKKRFKVSPGDIRKKSAGIHYQHADDQSLKNKVRNKTKFSRFGLKALLILLAIIITGGIIYFIFSEKEPSEKSIAILPFDNLSTDAENQFFANGLVEDLLHRLSAISELKVISRTSSEMFRNKGERTIPQIAEILDVNYILEGSVQREQEHIRIYVQLIDAKKDNHILSKQYDRKLSEFFETQTEIADQITKALSVYLTEKELSNLRKDKTNNLRAFEFYQLARFHASKRWIDGYQKSMEYYEKAIAEDPEYGLAYAGLADTYHLMALQDWMENKDEGVKLSITYAEKALQSDSKIAEAYAVLGDLNTYWDWNWSEAEKNLQEALRLNPNYATAHQYYSELLAITGRHHEARTHIDKAVELDPLSFVIRYFSGVHYYNEGYLRKTLEEFKLCNDLVENHLWILRMEFEVLYQLSMEQEAIESFKRYGQYFQNYEPTIADSVYRHEGLDGLLRLRIETEPNELLRVSGYILLGEYNKALELLGALVSENKVSDPCYFSRYEFRKIHNDPRYIDLINKMGLPPIYNK